MYGEAALLPEVLNPSVNGNLYCVIGRIVELFGAGSSQPVWKVKNTIFITILHQLYHYSEVSLRMEVCFSLPEVETETRLKFSDFVSVM